MKHSTFRPDGLCPKCGFQFGQMFRQFNDGEHDVIENKDVKKCTIKGEHLHLECCCGHTMVLRPLDWNLKSNTKPKLKRKERG